MKTLPSLARTRKAIAAYDEADERFNATQIETLKVGEAFALFDELERLGEAVGIAYGEDTQDRNSPETCRQCIRPGRLVPGPGCTESFVRRMVRHWEESSK
jgi:hypothetical protein